VVEEAGCQACEKLSPGERVCCGSEFSWKGSCSCYRALRILVRPVAEAQGKGGEAADGLCDSEGVYSWGGTGMWGMRVCEQWA
jgi:hypothetical protein